MEGRDWSVTGDLWPSRCASSVEWAWKAFVRSLSVCRRNVYTRCYNYSCCSPCLHVRPLTCKRRCLSRNTEHRVSHNNNVIVVSRAQQHDKCVTSHLSLDMAQTWSCSLELTLFCFYLFSLCLLSACISLFNPTPIIFISLFCFFPPFYFDFLLLP